MAGAPRLSMLFACTGITAVALTILLVSDHYGGGPLPMWMKMVASTAFIALAYFAGGLSTPYGRIILLALFFSWWGDFFLMWGSTFLYGLIAFFIGHVCYAIAFLYYGQQWSWTAGGALGVLFLVIPIFMWLNPHLVDDPMRIPVYAYMVVITLMVVLSVGAVGKGAVPWVAAAALLFYFSDIFVARARFVEPDEINRVIGLPLYYGGQVLFAWTVYWMNALSSE